MHKLVPGLACIAHNQTAMASGHRFKDINVSRFWRCLSAAGLFMITSALPVVQAAPLSFSEVAEKVLASAPELSARQAALDVARGRQTQAGYRPNPNLNLTAEDLAGTGAFSELGRSEITLSYQQRVERGGKRDARLQYSATDLRLAEYERQSAVLDLLYEVELEYRRVQALQAQAQAYSEQQTLARRLRDVVRERHERGRDSAVAVDNAELRLLRTELRLRQVQRDLEAARSNLQARWQWQDAAGSQDIVTMALEDQSFSDLTLPITADSVNELNHPDLLAWDQRGRRAAAALAVERSRAVQDPTFSAGLRYAQESEDIAIVLGVSLPLGIYDRNQGNIQAAAAQAEQVRWRGMDERLRWQRELQRFYAQAEQARNEARQLSEDLIERAQQAEQTVLQRRSQGAASDVEVYAAQSLAAELRLQLIDARERFHQARAGHRRQSAYYLQSNPQWFSPSADTTRSQAPNEGRANSISAVSTTNTANITNTAQEGW